MPLENMIEKVIMGVIGVVIFIALVVALGPTLISSAAQINATALSGVPLASVIVLLATYLPAFLYLAAVIGALAMIWRVTKAE